MSRKKRQDYRSKDRAWVEAKKAGRLSEHRRAIRREARKSEGLERDD